MQHNEMSLFIGSFFGVGLYRIAYLEKDIHFGKQVELSSGQTLVIGSEDVVYQLADG